MLDLAFILARNAAYEFMCARPVRLDLSLSISLSIFLRCSIAFPDYSNLTFQYAKILENIAHSSAMPVEMILDKV